MPSWQDSVLAFSSLPAVGALLLSPAAAWVWSPDAARLLWANPAGGEIIGAATFAAAWTRRWNAVHSLRRELGSIQQAMTPAGVVARLRIASSASSVPTLCRCSRVRAGSERGVLVISNDPLRGFSPAHALPSFFTDDGVTAFLTDENGRPELSGHSEQPYIPLAENGPIRRLYLLAGPSAQSEETADRTTSTVGGADPQSVATAVEVDKCGPDRAGFGDGQAQAETPLLALEEPGRTVAPASSPAASLLSPAVTADAQPRSVMAGRVPRELSRRPVRFLWQTDAAHRFLFVSPGLEQVVGRNAEIVGERWPDAANRLGLDPIGRIGRALAERDTWSGQTAWWPIEGSNVRVPAEMTALPIYGGDHSFQGYRGFGVLRPAEALMPLAYEARFGRPDGADPAPAEQLPPYEEAATTAAAPPISDNVVPIRADLDRVDHTRLSPQERSAFEEIAAALRDRVEASESPMAEHSGDASALSDENKPPVSAGESLDPPEALQALRDEPPDAPDPEDAPERAPYQATPAVPDPHESGSPPAIPDQARAASDGVLTPDRSTEEGAPASSADPVRTVRNPRMTDEGASQRLPRAVPELWITPPRTVRSAHRARPAAAAAVSSIEDPVAVAPRGDDAERRVQELITILNTAADGVVIFDSAGTIERVNVSAEALFGLDAQEMQGLQFTGLFTPATRAVAEDYLSGLRDNGVASLLNEGREVEARAGAGAIPLFLTMGHVSNDRGGRFCAVLRDITHWKRSETELLAAKRAAENASNQKSEFLARVSHEIRTPLNAIIGFAEIMMEERLGPIENERYREYLRDIRTSSEHVVSLVNDLLDISKIEAGRLDLHFNAVPLNDLVRECIAIMQPQAGRAHVVLRSSLSRDVPGVVGDARTLRQIVLNLLSNSVKFTGPGGQVIASTSLAETGEALLRIRDTGQGMSEEELARALEPFRQISTATLPDRAGTGLGLPLTKALVEANRASLAIRSALGEGTVVTITFPPTRVLSE